MATIVTCPRCSAESIVSEGIILEHYIDMAGKYRCDASNTSWKGWNA